MDSPNCKKILCIDDSQDTRELLVFILSEEGYRVEIASNVSEGVEVARSHKFGLYLVDLSFNDGSGFDLIEKIRTFDPETPIVVCSGDVRDAIQAQALQLGTRAFFTKPIDLDLLAQTVGKILDDESSV